MTKSINAHLRALASSDARKAALKLLEYQRHLPMGTQPTLSGGLCRADGWNVSLQQLNGDFALDPVLAKRLISGAMASSDIETKSSAQWMKQYLAGNSSGDPWSMERIGSEATNAAIGPGNILGNRSGVAHAVSAKRTADAIKAGLKAIEKGMAATVRINQYTTLYNANKSGKGAPRPRIRFRALPVQVVAESLKVEVRVVASGVNAAIKAHQAMQAARVAGMVGSLNSSARPAFWSRMSRGGGILTFAPSAAIDLNNNITRDLQGNINFNGRGFIKDSVKSQVGNVLGAATSAGVTLIAGGVMLAGAPLIVTALMLGIAVQILWGASGAGDMAADWVDGVLN